MTELAGKGGRQNRRVLVVAEDEAIHEDLSFILASAHGDDIRPDDLHGELFGAPSKPSLEPFALDSARQGDEAVMRVREAHREGRPYALVFVDFRTSPDIGGVDVTARLLDSDPQLDVVLCAASNDALDDALVRLNHSDRVLILKTPFAAVEVRQLAHALHRRWELARLVALRLDDLSAAVDTRTRELEAANARLTLEVAAREKTLRRLEESNAQVTALAYQDGLTGLPNRRLLNQYLERVLSRARRKGSRFAVLFIDFDNFKTINDTVGHHAADALLKQLAASLDDLIRTEDLFTQYIHSQFDIDTTVTLEPITDSVLSRLGGDEFVVLLPDTRDRFAAGNVASRVLKHLESPMRVQDRDIVVTASIGIATYPEDGQTGEALIRNADTAMYHAKQRGKAAYQYYSAEMNAASVERVKLETGLRRAIDDGALELHYQPEVDLGSGRIIGCEALIRWRDPIRGYVRPESFIEIAEDTGLILPLGEWALRQACGQAASWQRVGAAVPVSVNVSGVQLRRQNLPDVVGRALQDAGLEPRLLSLEITETAIIGVRERAQDALQALQTAGVSLALDDFGTGHSSLSCLRDFPVSVLKIDGSFVSELMRDAATLSITEAIVSIAHILGFKALAKGVESEEQIAVLEQLGCDAGQGSYFSPAVPPDEMLQLIRRGTLPAIGRRREIAAR